MANHNIERLSEDVKREITTAMREIKDSRVSAHLVTISHVEVTNDLSYCTVHVSCLDGEGATKEAIECLSGAQGFFKKRINARIKMRKMPELIFKPDNSLEYYAKIEGIIKNLPKRTTEESADVSDKDGNNED